LANLQEKIMKLKQLAIMGFLLGISGVAAAGGTPGQIEHDEEVAPLASIYLADGREVLTNSAGLTVYIFDKDDEGTSNCYDACAKAWPPVLVDAKAKLGKDISVATRKDGSHQALFKGQPVYIYVGDGKPTETNGDGLGGIWHVIEAE
jgi:predicted lipoprotein with Yx(FWY)xxD motif